MATGSQPQTIEALITGMIACRANARELLSDADLLVEHQRNARAYALLHTACEELGKFAVLELGATRLLRENPPDWKRFWQRFRSHDSKSAQLEVQLMWLATSSDEADEIVSSAETLFRRGLQLRNAALYVDLGPDGSFRKPSDIEFAVPIPELRAVTAHAFGAAQQRGATTAEIAQYLSVAPDGKVVVELLARLLERPRDAGLSKEQMLDLVRKRFK